MDQTATTSATSALTCNTCALFGHGCTQMNPDRFVENCTDYITNISEYVGVNEHAEATAKYKEALQATAPYIPADDVPAITKPDMVNHPNHYTQGGIECIKAIEASMPPDGFQDYCKGNVLKYIWRWRDKAGLEDLKKARVYLNWMIESVEKELER